MKHKEGELVKVLNDYGNSIGIGIYYSTFKPIDRRRSDVPEGVKDPFNETHWHYEVLINGILAWFHTNEYTLVGMKDESR